MEDTVIPKMREHLEELAKDKSHSHFPSFILEGLRVIHVGRGIVRCKMTVTHHVLKEDGTFHTAAIGVLMELMGATAVYSAGGSHVSVDLNYSLYSTAKIQEKVKIEARLVGKKREDLNAAIIKIRREYDEELIATGRLWMRLLMTSFNLYVKPNGVDQVSKL
ncbi:HotDog domain superfamily [Arabidopsis suecica]|uniref:Acyl-coenzyme A thioesterase 13 n=1 Tax=Arabidopsis suecica TaxID=45249 RepID=A0A8T2CTV9_ARASU|nr:HotDog domain superfamily [Arabidopsis suecica]